VGEGAAENAHRTRQEQRRRRLATLRAVIRGSAALAKLISEMAGLSGGEMKTQSGIYRRNVSMAAYPKARGVIGAEINSAGVKTESGIG